MQKIELVFIPTPGAGHLASAVETAKLLIGREQCLSISVLITKMPLGPKLSLPSSSDPRLRFSALPDVEQHATGNTPGSFFGPIIEAQKSNVKDIAAKIIESESTRLGGFVLDMFCTSMIDVANELGVPSYLFFASGAAVLGLIFHLQELADNHGQDITEFSTELVVPTYSNPVPPKILPSSVLDKETGAAMLLNLARRFRETKGIIVNTFFELEPYAIESFRGNEKIPPIYPVGPMLKLKSEPKDETTMILEWLDDQPESSVVFLCFGSMGCFDEEQIKEIANALEKTSCRFLWSLRQSPPKGKIELPTDFSDPSEVLPEGFLKRTAGVGKVIGWAPQIEVLSHPSVGGFVSHCGWNSTLESTWCGVPIAALPMYAEQQMNAFELVVELGMAVEIKMDYRKDIRKESEMVVTAEEIEGGIRKLMVEESEVKKKVKETSEKSRVALSEGGSSYICVGQLVQDIISNTPCYQLFQEHIN